MDTETLPPQIYKANNKRNVLLALVGLMAGAPIADWLLVYTPLAYQILPLFTAIGFAVGILIWCHIDARERGIVLGPGFRILVLLLAALAVPYYLFKSRGFIGGLIGIAWAWAFLIVLLIVSTIVNLLLALISDRLHILR